MITLLSLTPYTGDLVAPSPNHDTRRAPSIEGIVLHATADQGDEDHSLAWMRSPRSRVSCHLLVSRGGQVTRLVGDRERAWHAGESWWRGTSDVNSITLGIEIANRNDGEPFTDSQYDRVAEIVAYYCGQGLSLDDVVSHEEIAKGRKTDPLDWDWSRMRAAVRYRALSTGDRLHPPPVRPAILAKQELPNVSSVVPAVVVSRANAMPAPTKSKHVLQSRTIWVNALMALAAGGMLAGNGVELAHRVGIHIPHLPEGVTKWALFIIGIVNIILRLRTSRPLRCTPDGHCAPPPAPEPSSTTSELPQLRVARASSGTWRRGGVETFGWRA